MSSPDVPDIVGVLARVYVDDLDAALSHYGHLAAGATPHHFGFGDLRLAIVGPFLLIEGAGPQVRDRAATILVRNVATIAAFVADTGGQLLDGPMPGPNGPRLVARHPDGTVIEYIEMRE